MPKNVMIDFETLGLGENAVLLSLGACVFDTETSEVGADVADGGAERDGGGVGGDERGFD